MLVPALAVQAGVLPFELATVTPHRHRRPVVDGIAAAELAEEGVGALVDAVVATDEGHVQRAALPRHRLTGSAAPGSRRRR